jgi:hypothetical protein
MISSMKVHEIHHQKMKCQAMSDVRVFKVELGYNLGLVSQFQKRP